MGEIEYPARVRETYASDLLGTLDVDAIKERGFRIVVDYGYSAASLVLPLVLGPLGVEVVAAHAFSTNRSQADPTELSPVDRAGEAARPGGRRPTSAPSSTARASGCT